MTPEQHEQMMIALNEHTRTLYRIRESLDQGLGAIREQLIAGVGPKLSPIVPAAPVGPHVADPVFVPMRGRTRDEQPARPAENTAGGSMADAVAIGQRQALSALLNALTDRIDAVRAHHREVGHRAEPVGSECWRIYRPVDIRDMVNEVARNLGVPMFQPPAVAPENLP